LLLDGFVIKGNVVERASMKGASVTEPLLKKHFLTIFVSLLVHLILALLLFFATEIQPPKKVEITKKAIKSYLYNMPAKANVIKPIVVKTDVIQNSKPKKVNVPKTSTKIAAKTVAKPLKNKSQSPSIQKDPVNQAVPVVKSVAKPIVKPLASSKAMLINKEPVEKSYSSYQQLKSLRSSLNKKMRNDSFSDLQQFRSPSVMTGNQIPVPHSNQQLTREEKRKKTTKRMSNDISITKNDDGTCIIEREQFLGSPIEGSVSAFACGESKFDKSFREHMKKVQDKINPNR
jgi:hypothetical protein